MILLGIAAVSYWILYFRFVPQIGLERDVHLQFGYVARYARAWSKQLVTGEQWQLANST